MTVVSPIARRLVSKSEASMLAPAVKDAASGAVQALGERFERSGASGLPRRAAALRPSAAELAVMNAATTHNAVTLHVTPEESMKALLDSIQSAKKSFYIETFIWHNDASGNAIIKALGDKIQAAKAKGETFDAKVLIDWFGLRQGTGGNGDRAIIQKLKDVGVDVLEFSPGYITDCKILPLTHRKLYIQDGTQFITGGRNIGDEYLAHEFVNPKGGKDLSWHDLLYTVKGDETGRVVDQFLANWKRAGGKETSPRPEIIPNFSGNAKVQSFVTNPVTGVHDIQSTQIKLIENASSEIVIMYPYLSDEKLLTALENAKRKNPKLSIKVILPANREVTIEGSVYQALNNASARRLERVGAQVHLYAGGLENGKPIERFTHFKGMMIDDEILSIGGANGDQRTMDANHELITVISDPTTVREFKAKVTDRDWAESTNLPLNKLERESWTMRIKEWLLQKVDFIL